MVKNTLEHLLGIEAEAAALVNDAEKEAERRIRENDEKNRVTYDERLKAETQRREAQLETEVNQLKKEYQQTLDNYRDEISRINVNQQEFSVLLNTYLSGNADVD